MEVVKGLSSVVAARTTEGRKAWKRVVAAGGDGGRGVYHPYRVGHLIMGGQRVCWGWVRVGVGMWVGCGGEVVV